MKGLGRKVPTDWKHVEKYPFKLTPQAPTPVPVTIGINWYSDFDSPQKDDNGMWWIGKDPNNLGVIRGGHCVCIPHNPKRDLASWYKYYNQGDEGACVGFGSSRMMSLINRKMYNPWWLWDEAKKVDEWADTNPGDSEGTSVRAAMDVLRSRGHERKRAKFPNTEDGITENRWATNIDDLFSVLQNEKYKQLGALPILNSWGNESYPHIVWIPCETHDKLLHEDGEYTMINDRV